MMLGIYIALATTVVFATVLYLVLKANDGHDEHAEPDSAYE